MTGATYSDSRKTIKTGDVLLVEGRSLAARLVRVFTGQQASHVGLFVRVGDDKDGGLWVAEMRPRGFTLTPASTRVGEVLEAGDYAYLGEAPGFIRDNHNGRRAALNARLARARYSFWSLVAVWASQVFSVPLHTHLVCSTYVQQAWEACGFQFAVPPDPGDFFRLCVRTEGFKGAVVPA